MWHVARKRHLLTYYTIIITIHIIAMYKAVSVYWIFVGLLSVTWFLMYFISQFLLRRSRKTVEILYITFFRISFYFYIPQILRALERESLCPSLWRAESRKFSHAYCLYPIYKDASCFILTPLLTNTLLHAFFFSRTSIVFYFLFSNFEFVLLVLPENVCIYFILLWFGPSLRYLFI